MRTTIVKDDAGKEWCIVHNGDWSGEARIRPVGVVGPTSYEAASTADIVLPGFVLRNACRAYVAAEIAGTIETVLAEYVEGKR